MSSAALSWSESGERQHLGPNGWQLPVPFGSGINTSESEAAPSYFENRQRGLPQLFFNRFQPGGVTDIYAADAFGSAVPVAELNSPVNDTRPSMTADGLEIFFNSNRTGSAGNDMYSAVRTSVLEPWSEPKSLGPVVNTASNELLGAISPDGETLFFTSTREGGFGSNDLYMTTRTKHHRR